MTTRADYSIRDLGESENWGREGGLKKKKNAAVSCLNWEFILLCILARLFEYSCCPSRRGVKKKREAPSFIRFGF